MVKSSNDAFRVRRGAESHGCFCGRCVWGSGPRRKLNEFWVLLRVDGFEVGVGVECDRGVTSSGPKLEWIWIWGGARRWNGRRAGVASCGSQEAAVLLRYRWQCRLVSCGQAGLFVSDWACVRACA